MAKEFQISTVLPSTNPTQVITNHGFILQREQVIESLVRLHLQLGETYEVRLNPQRVAAGVKAMLENPALGHVVLAWRSSDHRVVGQLEVKKPFEVWYNAGYWYIDNHVVFEYDQRETVGTALLDYVSREA